MLRRSCHAAAVERGFGSLKTKTPGKKETFDSGRGHPETTVELQTLGNPRKYYSQIFALVCVLETASLDYGRFTLLVDSRKRELLMPARRAV